MRTTTLEIFVKEDFELNELCTGLAFLKIKGTNQLVTIEESLANDFFFTNKEWRIGKDNWELIPYEGDPHMTIGKIEVQEIHSIYKDCGFEKTVALLVERYNMLHHKAYKIVWEHRENLDFRHIDDFTA